MSDSVKADETVEALLDEALSMAIERGDSQAVIDILSVTQEYIHGNGSEDFYTPPSNIQTEVLPKSYPVERLEKLD